MADKLPDDKRARIRLTAWILAACAVASFLVFFLLVAGGK